MDLWGCVNEMFGTKAEGCCAQPGAGCPTPMFGAPIPKLIAGDASLSSEIMALGWVADTCNATCKLIVVRADSIITLG
ncbi:hypothetical protein V6N13_047140 [Hibiscus sabdariffa]